MKAKIPSLTLDRALELFLYEPASGEFVWCLRRGGSARAGTTAGKTHRTGYRYLTADGERIFAHRIAWLIAHGRWAEGQIDHIDGNRANNAAGNLRELTQTGNSQNQRHAHAGAKVGLLGVTMKRQRFCAQLGGQTTRKKHIGYFDTAEEAHQAYLAAKRLHHEACTI